MTTMNADTSSRSDQRRRRAQKEKDKRRVNLTAEGARLVRPLVSRPYGSSGGILPKRRKPFRLSLPSEWQDSLTGLVTTWRFASALLLVVMVGALAYTFTDTRMYVTSIHLEGATIVPLDEVFADSGVARQHIFWVNPREAQKRIEQIPGIISAVVNVEWPSAVNITVQERVPLVGLQQGESKLVWVDAGGIFFASRGELPGLLPIVSETPTALSSLPLAVIQGALQLRELRPNIERLYYAPQDGLSYQDGRGWRGYFGVGTDMAQKLAVYETLVADLLKQGLTPTLISVKDLNAPFYRK